MPLVTPPGGWCITPGANGYGVAAEALYYGGAVVDTWLSKVLWNVLSPFGVSSAQIAGALNTARSQVAATLQLSVPESTELYQALWQPTVIALQTVNYALNEAVAALQRVKGIIIPNTVFELQRQIGDTWVTLMHRLQNVATALTTEIAQGDAATLGASTDYAQAVGTAVARYAQALTTAEAQARAQGDQAVLADATAQAQTVADYARTVGEESIAYTDRVRVELSDDITRTQQWTQSEIAVSTQQAEAYAKLAAESVGAGVGVYLATQVLPVLSKVATEVDTCVEPYCTGIRSVGKTLNTLASVGLYLALMAWLAEAVADPGAAAAQVDDVLAPVAEATYQGIAAVVGLAT